MAYANRKQMSSNRTAAIAVVILIHVVLGYALVSGLAYNIVKTVAPDLKTFDVTEPPPPPEDKPPPPPEKVEAPPPPVAPPAIVQTQISTPPPIVTVATPPPVQPPPVITPPPPPPPPVKQQAARAKGSLLGLFSDDDYPNAALQAQQQGSTSVSLTIGTDGRVSGCSVTSSSGSAALDSATCNVLRRRAKFSPAIDSNGQPTGDTYSQRVTWRLPAD